MAAWIRWGGALALSCAVGGNLLAWRHARAMTQFVEGGERTERPEHLSVREKVATLLFGVTIPRPRSDLVPSQIEPGARSVRIEGPEGALDLLVIGAGEPVVILVHGYAGERTQTLPTARRLRQAGYTVVAPDLRAAGSSDGSRTSLGWHEAADVAAVAGWVGAHLGDEAPVLYGFSMGGAAVVGAAGRLGVRSRGLVIESTFDRLVNTVGHRFETMGLPARGLSDLLLFWGGIQQGFDPWAVAPVEDAVYVEVPTLIVAGDRDLRVSPGESRALAAAFGVNGTLALIEGMGHAQLASAEPERWSEIVRPFLTEIAPVRRVN